MIRATKATKTKLYQMIKHNQNTIAEILLERITIAENIESCITDGFTLTADDYSKGYYTDTCLYIKTAIWEKPYFSGLYTKYEGLINCTFTHGNNEVVIPNINKLVKAMYQ